MKTAWHIVFVILIAACATRKTQLGYPDAKTYSQTKGDLKVSATVLPPDDTTADYRVKINWEHTNPASKFYEPSLWKIWRSKNCPPEELSNDENRPRAEFQFEQVFWKGSQEYDLHSYLDDNEVENNTCYTYNVIAGIYHYGETNNLVVEDINIAVPIGNVGFYE